MRGKLITTLLIAVFFSTLLVNIGFAAPPLTNTSVTVTPSLNTGLPGAYFTVAITIADVADVYAWEIDLHYPPYLSVITVTKVTDGGFLAGGFFVSSDNPFAGVVTAGSTLIGNVPGVSGSGTLCTIEFYILEAGEGPLELEVALVKRVGGQLYDIPVRHIGDSYFQGPTVDLVRLEILPGRDMLVGDMAEFDAKVRNDGNVPLYVYVTFEIERIEDAYFRQLQGGQWWYGLGTLPAPWWIDPLECDGYYVHWGEGFFGVYWNKVGSNWLSAIDYPTNYLWADETQDAAMSAAYTFEDMTLDPKNIINEVTLEGYTHSTNINIDLDMYTVSPTVFDWLGSLWGTTTWGWHSPRWTTESVLDTVPAVGTEAGLNSIELLTYHYAPDPVDYAGVMMADALRLNVQLASKTEDNTGQVYVVQPGGTLEIDPTTIGNLHVEDVGTYVVKATAWYSYYGTFFNPGAKVRSLNYKISE